MVKRFANKFPGKVCTLCGGPIAIGQEMLWRPREGSIKPASCHITGQCRPGQRPGLLKLQPHIVIPAEHGLQAPASDCACAWHLEHRRPAGTPARRAAIARRKAMARVFTRVPTGDPVGDDLLAAFSAGNHNRLYQTQISGEPVDSLALTPQSEP